MDHRFAIAILAAGQGTRFRSQRAKVLHEAGGRTLIEHVVQTAAQLSPRDIFVIVGHQAEAVIAHLQERGFRRLKFIFQKERLGTGHALRSGRGPLANAAPQLLVLSGDTPLLTPQTLRKLIAAHRRSQAAATVLTAEMDDPTGYGRILRASGGTDGRSSNHSIIAIVEQKSATAEQRQIREVNSGIYCFQTQPLFRALQQVKLDPIKKEYYLTDVIALLAGRGLGVHAFRAEDPQEVIGINDRVELARVDNLLRLRKARELMRAGVTIQAPESVRIDAGVRVGPDTEIEPGAVLRGRTRIGTNCRIGAGCIVADSELADGVVLRPCCVLTESRIASGAVIGPFSHLRPGTEIGPGSQIGAFVEVKKSRIGRGVHAHHLAYLGDAVLGDGVNVGAGTITCNFDGTRKHQTVIEDGVFLGSGTELVAPLRVGRGAYVAAGSTITEEVPAHALALARARQVVKAGWAARRKAPSAAKPGR
ncbi:MAG TPA: bifunctional UDP-N-acetylglucosamine diphosphorylase/glucosamine-1-phosphate N-acetyltransferase GlmU [Terriglobia bacterium]|nr:bifunctional UDP-N-acetylglucosamine diphosphorylase/glucosamine-1-phosphate N-acetyltransferase GlmU [Terriglobia bacterium]